MEPALTALDEIKARVSAIEEKLADGSLEPATAREFLMALTGLGGPVSNELRRAELNYKPVLLTFLSGDGTAARAKIQAECSPEFAEWREAKDLSDQVHQLIISCRGYLRSLDEEARLAR
jgi:hypothetical protein